MREEKLAGTKMGDMYRIVYPLDINDVIDAKVYDMSRSGGFSQMIVCNMHENNGAREFVYEVANMRSLTEILKNEINKKQMLTMLYNIMSGLEELGRNMISISYVSKEIRHIFASSGTYDIKFVVVPVNKDGSDLESVRTLVKTIISGARYAEADGDNYVARLINLANVQSTFSIVEMKKGVGDMLSEMGIDIEQGRHKSEPVSYAEPEQGNSHILRGNAPSQRVSRLGVMRQNAMRERQMAQNGVQMQGRPQPMPPQMQGMPQPMPPQMQGMPQPMPPQMQGMPPQMQSMPQSEPTPIPEPTPTPELTPIPEPESMPTPKPMPERQPISQTSPVTGGMQDAPSPYFMRERNGERIDINKSEFKIGHKASMVDYAIEDNSAVSRVHCIITKRNGVCFIRDNDSTNGTYINNSRLQDGAETFLTNNAVVILGDEEFIFHVR